MECFLDVSQLEPPEPLERALAAAETLPPGAYLRLIHRRYPCLLEAQLAERGFRCEVVTGEDDTTETFIWHDGDDSARDAARRHMASLS